MNNKLHRDGGLPAIEWADEDRKYYVNGIKVTEEQAQFIHIKKMKRVKKVYWRWCDITYQLGKSAFKARMMRDLASLENEIGYKLNEIE